MKHAIKEPEDYVELTSHYTSDIVEHNNKKEHESFIHATYNCIHIISNLMKDCKNK